MDQNKNQNKDIKKTVGQLSLELLKSGKGAEDQHSAFEQAGENLTDYEKELFWCVNDNKDRLEDDFFIEVQTKKEKILPDTIHSYFIARRTCPTPNYDQVAYKYYQKEERIEFLWVVPDRKISKYMKANASRIDPSQFELLSYVLKFADGSLYAMSKELNGEKRETPELKDN